METGDSLERRVSDLERRVICVSKEEPGKPVSSGPTPSAL